MASEAVRIGARLRRARSERGMTIAELANVTGLSKGFLSLVERDRANTSVASLVRICEALGIAIGPLFDARQPSFVPKAERTRVHFGGEGVTEHLLSPSDEPRLQAIESIVAPGGGSGAEPYALRADAELVHVIAGRLDVTVAGERTRMRAGDTLSFSPRDPHSWVNPSRSAPAHVIWVVTPAPS